MLRTRQRTRKYNAVQESWCRIRRTITGVKAYTTSSWEEVKLVNDDAFTDFIKKNAVTGAEDYHIRIILQGIDGFYSLE
jgi:hypothetical protein